LESIIDRFLELLPASDVPFGRLHRSVTKQKPNLFEFASSAMAEPSTGTAKVMWCEMIQADTLGIMPHRGPNHIHSNYTAQIGFISRDSPE